MVYKFTMEYTVRGNFPDAVNAVKEELGGEQYDSHVLVKEIADTNQVVDLDLTKVEIPA